MFSGLTNQVSSWMGAAKGEAQEEQVPVPAQSSDAGLESSQGESPATGGKGRMELLSNVKSQVSGWLPTNISIPGLKKGAEEEQIPPPVEQPSQEETQAAAKDDDDNSRYNSATGGADSGPASATGTPTEEQPANVANDIRKRFSIAGNEVDIGELTTKAVAGAKSLGNFLYSAVNKAGAKVSEASAKIKETVEKTSILGELSREQEAFIKGQEGKSGGAAAPPWAGQPNEQALREECLSLATDKRNFVRAPPQGVHFDFDYDAMYPIAQAIMDEDQNLSQMRFDLVPKVITEENFWRNYFYRVSLICQANEADATAAADAQANQQHEEQEPWERELEEELRDFTHLNVADTNVDSHSDTEPDLK